MAGFQLQDWAGAFAGPSLAKLTVGAGVERTAQKRLDLIPELYRVLGPQMHLIGFRVAPCLDDREMVGSKLILAFPILFGMRFCALVLYRCEEYAQDVHSHTRFWYCTVEALEFSTLVSFCVPAHPN